jgi:serine/threonine protein kinase
MKPPHWDRIQEIYHAALATPRSERSTFIANAANHDPVIIREVEALLAADDSLEDFLEQPVCELGFNGFSTEDAAPDNLVGSTVDGRYLIERELVPRGGFSKVYAARAVELNSKLVCIKVLLRDFVEDSYVRRKFTQEVAALSRIDHPGVVGVLGSGELPDGRPYIAMQYVEGETLRSQIPSEGLDLERAASILRQIGVALEHVHQKDIFHRDLKPENIMLKRETDSVVLLDFGIAKVKESLIAQTTVNESTAGTLRYMSPEQLRGEEITAASDIYSLGVIAYELVTGRLPFNPRSRDELIQMQRAGVRVKPIHLREISSNAQDIMLRALLPDPKARFQNAREFGDKLANALLESRVGKGRGELIKAVKSSLVVLLAVTLLCFGIYIYLKFTEDTRPSRSMRYWLTVQQVRDEKDYRDPYKSNGEETFEQGDKFQLSVLTPQPGYLYVLNEGPLELTDTNFTMIFPRSAANNGSATLGANQTVQSEWKTFRGPPGAENFWLVWSPSPVPQLELAKAEAFRHPRGGLSGQNLVEVKDFLRLKKSELGVKVLHYEASQTAIATTKNEMVVTLVQFKHR